LAALRQNFRADELMPSFINSLESIKLKVKLSALEVLAVLVKMTDN